MVEVEAVAVVGDLSIIRDKLKMAAFYSLFLLSSLLFVTIIAFIMHCL